jgi:hypothetical protein
MLLLVFLAQLVVRRHLLEGGPPPEVHQEADEQDKATLSNRTCYPLGCCTLARHADTCQGSDEQSQLGDQEGWKAQLQASSCDRREDEPCEPGSPQ